MVRMAASRVMAHPTSREILTAKRRDPETWIPALEALAAVESLVALVAPHAAVAGVNQTGQQQQINHHGQTGLLALDLLGLGRPGQESGDRLGLVGDGGGGAVIEADLVG